MFSFSLASYKEQLESKDLSLNSRLIIFSQVTLSVSLGLWGIGVLCCEMDMISTSKS